MIGPTQEPEHEKPYKRIQRKICEQYNYCSEICWTAKKAVRDHCNRYYGKYGRWKYVKKTISVLTIIGVGIYTLVSCGLYNTAQKQLDISRDTEIRQLRAYVSIAVNDPVDNFAVGQKAHVSGVLRNDGQTPAYDGKWISGINITSDPVAPANFAYDSCQAIMERHVPGEQKWFLPKSIAIHKWRSDPFTQNEINDITSNVALLYFHGRVCYRDIYKEIRWADFCFRWPWKDGHFDRPEYCDSGNDGDH